MHSASRRERSQEVSGTRYGGTEATPRVLAARANRHLKAQGRCIVRTGIKMSASGLEIRRFEALDHCTIAFGHILSFHDKTASRPGATIDVAEHHSCEIEEARGFSGLYREYDSNHQSISNFSRSHGVRKVGGMSGDITQPVRELCLHLFPFGPHIPSMSHDHAYPRSCRRDSNERYYRPFWFFTFLLSLLLGLRAGEI